jgi:hypothetical protein
VCCVYVDIVQFIVCTNTNEINKNTFFTRGFLGVFFLLFSRPGEQLMLKQFSGFYFMLNLAVEKLLKVAKKKFYRKNSREFSQFPGMKNKHRTYFSHFFHTKSTCVSVCLHVCLLLKVHFLSFHRFQDVNLVVSFLK